MLQGLRVNVGGDARAERRPRDRSARRKRQRHRRDAGRRHDVERGRHDVRQGLGRERALAPLRLLRSAGAGAGIGERRRRHGRGRAPDHELRQLVRRKRLPARWRQRHRQLLQRGVLGAESRRDRRSRGAVARRAGGVRQPDGRRLQHRHQAGHEPVSRRRQLLLPVGRPHVQQHEEREVPERQVRRCLRRRSGRPLPVDARRLLRGDGAARRSDCERQALVLRLVRAPEGPVHARRRELRACRAARSTPRRIGSSSKAPGR